MKILLAAALLFSFQFGIAQNLKPNRDAFTLTLAVDGKQVYEENIKSNLYFRRKDILQIYPTEKLFIEVDIKADTIFSMQVVRQNLNSAKTIEIEFSQNVKDNRHEFMMLKVSNPFNKKLFYKARIYILGQEKWAETSILPVAPKLMGIEFWPDVILSLAIYDIRLKQ